MFSRENPLLLLAIASFLILQSACASFSQNRDYDAIREEARRAPVSLGFRDVRLGMQMNDVQQAWGTPSRVESAGDPSLGNERWTYHESPLGRQSLSGSRMVYFENGRVVGWETAQN